MDRCKIFFYKAVLSIIFHYRCYAQLCSSLYICILKICVRHLMWKIKSRNAEYLLNCWWCKKMFRVKFVLFRRGPQEIEQILWYDSIFIWFHFLKNADHLEISETSPLTIKKKSDSRYNTSRNRTNFIRDIFFFLSSIIWQIFEWIDLNGTPCTYMW